MTSLSQCGVEEPQECIILIHPFVGQRRVSFGGRSRVQETYKYIMNLFVYGLKS